MKGIITMKKTATSSIRYFRLDLLNRKINGSKNAFKAADKGYGDAYDQLMALMAQHPDFVLVVVEQKRHTEKAKETYKGMDIPWMRAYLEMEGNKANVEKFEKVIQFAVKNNKKAFPLAKKYFLKQFKDNNDVIHFDYAKARAEVEEYLVNKTTLEQDKTEAEENTASTAENKPASTKKAA